MCRAFDAAYLHGLDVLALAKRATGRDEPDLRERSGSGAKRHVGNRVGQAIGETGDGEPCRSGCIFEARFDTAQPLRIERRVRGGCVDASAERPEQLVERRHPPAEIGR